MVSNKLFVMKPAALFLLMAAIGCASAGPARSPHVKISQASRVVPVRTAVAPLGDQVSNGVPVDYEIEVTNPFDYPVSLTSVELETVGASGAYSMRRVRHVFSLIIKPQSATVLPVRAWVLPLQDTDAGDVNGPVTVRGIASFTTDAGVMKTAFAARVQ
ncbi:MAG: hypothetical protein QOC81_2395 [Thermoanaerobaculia bacterium]|jgi:hypothetical protein|nr:hypothetical protein [Thermoanaerobaculia bacterium]